MTRHTYQAAERFILSREFFGMKLGLQNISEFLEQIGNPQNAYATIHVAGTNGKGSTSAMIEAALRAQGREPRTDSDSETILHAYAVQGLTLGQYDCNSSPACTPRRSAPLLANSSASSGGCG